MDAVRQKILSSCNLGNSGISQGVCVMFGAFEYSGRWNAVVRKVVSWCEVEIVGDDQDVCMVQMCM